MEKPAHPKSSFTDEEFFDLIKHDPEAIKEYIEGLRKLYQRTYTTDELIKWYVDKAIKKKLKDFTQPDMLKLSGFLNFIRSIPNPERYLREK